MGKTTGRTLAALAAGLMAFACQRAGQSPTAPDIPTLTAPAPQASANNGTLSASSVTPEGFISDEDRRWFKTHRVSYEVNGTTITVTASNPWDHAVAQGDAKDFWLIVFDKTTNPQTFIARGGPRRLGAKDSISISVDIGKGHCYVEAEFALDDGTREGNGGPAYYLFGVGNLQIADCKDTPTRRQSCEVKPVDQEEPDITSPTTLPSPPPRGIAFCDLCDNIEGDQQDVPLDDEGFPLVRTFDEETGLFLCLKRVSEPPPDLCLNIDGLQLTVPEGYYRDEAGNCYPTCVEAWIAQQPVVTYGDWGACAEVLEEDDFSSSSGNYGKKCERSRTVRTVVNEINSCTQASRVKSDIASSQSEACACPVVEPGTCFYNISGAPIFRPLLCALAGDGIGGTVGNWNGAANHCEVPFPGVSNDQFQLTPGQSDTGCLRKQDD